MEEDDLLAVQEALAPPAVAQLYYAFGYVSSNSELERIFFSCYYISNCLSNFSKTIF